MKINIKNKNFSMEFKQQIKNYFANGFFEEGKLCEKHE